jgi:hypothetical protein
MFTGGNKDSAAPVAPQSALPQQGNITAATQRPGAAYASFVHDSKMLVLREADPHKGRLQINSFFDDFIDPSP